MSTPYVHPEVLVETDWVAAHAKDPGIRLIEVDVDTAAYDQGHLAGAVGWNWQTQLQDQIRRTLATKTQFEALCSEAGITPETTVILYGDNNNWFAAWALWQFKYYGHKDVRLMNGGRKKWLLENRPVSTEKPAYPKTAYRGKDPDNSIRAFRDQVMDVLKQPGIHNLVDVRSPDEYTGKVIAPPGMSETAQRGGHIPTAKSIPWAQAVKEDGSFKSAEDLKALYEGKGVVPGKDTIAYCRIGERSSHTWFVLRYLLGYPNVRNYDGSWTEWGNLVEAPIEKTERRQPAGGRMSVTTAKQFDIWTSDKSFRYKEEAIHNHAPQSTGIYYLVTFDAQQNGKTLYMGLIQDSTIFKALFEHWEGLREPKVQDLLARYPNLYFMYIVQSNATTPEDQKDLFWALAQQEKPELLDWKALPNTGRYSEITVKDKSIL